MKPIYEIEDNDDSLLILDLGSYILIEIENPEGYAELRLSKSETKILAKCLKKVS